MHASHEKNIKDILNFKFGFSIIFHLLLYLKKKYRLGMFLVYVRKTKTYSNHYFWENIELGLLLKKVLNSCLEYWKMNLIKNVDMICFKNEIK